MKLPSKIISYRESALSKFPPILTVLQNADTADTSVFSLYEITKKYFCSIEEFMDTLDCLFALHKIAYDEEREVIYCVV